MVKNWLKIKNLEYLTKFKKSHLIKAKINKVFKMGSFTPETKVVFI